MKSESAGLLNHRTAAENAGELNSKLLGKSLRLTSVCGTAIYCLKEGRGLEHVDRLGYLRFDKLPFARGYECLVFAGLVVHERSALRILILVCQEIPPGMSQTNNYGCWSFVAG